MSDLDSAIAFAALDQAPWGVMILIDQRIVWVNSSLAEMLHTTADRLVGLSRDDAVMPAGLDALFGDDSTQLVLSLDDDEKRWLRRWQRTLSSGEAEVHFLEDITGSFWLEEERARLQALVESLETRDSETGLLNHTAIIQSLESQISRSRRYGNPLSVIRLRLTPPADAKDPQSTLRAISQEFNAQLRWADQIGRLDRATFLLILPETSLKDAEELALKFGHDRVALVSRAEGWTLELSATAWRKGDDARKLLARL